MVHVVTSTFRKDQTLAIEAKNYFDVGYQFGMMVKSIVQRRMLVLSKQSSNYTFRPKALTRELLTYAETVSKSDVCVIGNRNVLQEYLNTFYGYCIGADISKEQGVQLQADISTGCQTMFIRDKITKSIGFLHTEENFDDPFIRSIYRHIDTHSDWNPSMELPAEIKDLYHYSFVRMRVSGASYEYLAYPELCFGGPAMGLNNQEGSFMAVDSLYTKTTFTPNALWANAIASMFFLLGNLEDIRTLIRQMKKAGIYILNGYAFHIANTRSLSLSSFEYGGKDIVEVRPTISESREYICQPNFPRSYELSQSDELLDEKQMKDSFDVWNAQTILEMETRIMTMKQYCTNESFPIDISFPERMKRHMYDKNVYFETDYHDTSLKSSTGFMTVYLVGYATGIFTQTGAILEIGPLFPHMNGMKRTKFWYTSHDTTSLIYVDLYQEAIKRFAS